MNAFVKRCLAKVDVFGGLFDGKQLAADRFFLLCFVLPHVHFPLSVGNPFFPGGQFRPHPVIDSLEVLPFQETASLLDDPVNVVAPVKFKLILVPGIHPFPLRAVQQGQGQLRPPVKSVYYHRPNLRLIKKAALCEAHQVSLVYSAASQKKA